ncbi:hypothetical protein GCK72_016391 [Caenorhabditis remanei]|uniref:Uncharacterized protein n=1 Tax=Caenorhabditis remanei TaxID=31234 RepID=A0A6A5G4I7_CAERE|nr:hypothetical protein GCK72_016391 [Caenorhabditis remanei]KAF1749846.1 hypothetical protein GCK72_016391 [Caenorhabditis remanei]
MMDNPERFRAVIRVLLRQQLADVSILNELNKKLSKMIMNHPEPNLRLGSMFHRAQCVKEFKRSKIQVTFPLLLPEELLIWKCEDIGIIRNGTYEFYKLNPSWMVEDEGEKTFKININECVKNQFNQTFCQTGAKVFYDAKCSINNVETCSRTYVKPKEKHGSYSRTLPNANIKDQTEKC